jgi:SAM-dependent methyltransferase
MSTLGEKKPSVAISKAWKAFVSTLISKQTARIKLRNVHYRIFRKSHPTLRLGEEWRESCYTGIQNDCGFIFGPLVTFLRTLKPTLSTRLLLAGDTPASKAGYTEIMGLSAQSMIATGLDDGVDIRWNFEDAPPSALGMFDVIVSHSIIEHLIDPYKHVRDLVGLLNTGGHLAIHTVAPGFPYHAYPIDCMRFYPDWFVAVADRNKLTLVEQFTSEDHLLYVFRK